MFRKLCFNCKLHSNSTGKKIQQKSFHSSVIKQYRTLQTENVYTPKNGSLYLHKKMSSHQILPQQMRIVIAGAGAVANSVAYHLVLKGWNDIVILEQNKIGSGTSHFGSGTLALLKPLSHRNLISYSIKLYSQLQDEGFNVGFRKNGSLNLAQTKDRMISLKRRVAYNLPTGLECEFLGKEDIKKKHPYLNIEDIEGGVWVPEDAVVNPVAVCEALANLARQGGVQYFEDCCVEEVFTENGRIKKVKTDRGIIECEYFVNCAGMWARELGLWCNPSVKIPAYPAENLYAIASVSYSESNLPCVHDLDYHSYIQAIEEGFLIGWFENEAKAAFVRCKNIPLKDWQTHLQNDPHHWKPLWDRATHRIPSFNNLKPFIYNCPDTFTPDGRWILGESSTVKNYFVAVGMNGNTLQGAGGIGKELAEWMVHGETTQELLPFNFQRFMDLHSNKYYLQLRVREIVGRNYAILYPHQCEYKYARKLRCSPLYSVLEDQGAIFGIKMGYERPIYFDSTYRRGLQKPLMPPGTYYKPKFFKFMLEEFQACQEGVGIIDMSSFSKINIQSSHLEVVDYLQQLCSSDIDIPVGSIIHTGMQNERGGYENDCLLVRQEENSYFMVSPTLQKTRIFRWMTSHLPHNHSVKLNDVTSNYTVVNVIGPKANQLLAELSNSTIKIPPFTYKRINIAYASDVMVMGFTHTGEPGYCLYIPSEYALHIYSRLMEVGRDYGVRNVGVLTQRLMRIEKFIPFWAEELTPFVTPFEAGSGHRIHLHKKSFNGKNILEEQKEKGVCKRLVLFVISNLDLDKDVWAWGGEPVYRNDEFVGTITSAGYGFNLKKLVGLGYIGSSKYSYSHNRKEIITNDFIMDPTAAYEIDIAGHRFPITPHIHPPLIPLNSINNKKYAPTPVTAYKSELTG